MNAHLKNITVAFGIAALPAIVAGVAGCGREANAADAQPATSYKIFSPSGEHSATFYTFLPKVR